MVDASHKSLKQALVEAVDPSAAIHTDEWRGYAGIGAYFAGGHHTVRHSAGEYARHGVHTNTAEGFFALLKRGIHGSFHHISVQHMPKYLNEFSFRWNLRKVTDEVRTEEAIKGGEGKRLMYRDPIAK